MASTAKAITESLFELLADNADTGEESPPPPPLISFEDMNKIYELPFDDGTVGYHVIVPTVLHCVMNSTPSIKKLCCLCSADMRDSIVVAALRCIVSQTGYKTQIKIVFICEACMEDREIVAGMSADNRACNVVLKQVRDCVEEMRDELASVVDVPPRMFFMLFMNRARARRAELMKALGDIENLCSHCGKLAKPRCTVCKLAHYCDKRCANKDWQRHKLECGLLKQASIYFQPRFHVEITAKL